MNLAAIWKLPIVFVCENNGYAQAAPVEYAVPLHDITARAPDTPVPFSAVLEALYTPRVDQVVAAVHDIMG